MVLCIFLIHICSFLIAAVEKGLKMSRDTEKGYRIQNKMLTRSVSDHGSNRKNLREKKGSHFDTFDTMFREHLICFCAGF